MYIFVEELELALTAYVPASSPWIRDKVIEEPKRSSENIKIIPKTIAVPVTNCCLPAKALRRTTTARIKRQYEQNVRTTKN